MTNRHAEFGFLVARIARRMRQAVDAEMRLVGLTEATWRPLMYLRTLGDGVRQKELATTLSIEGMHLTPGVDVLTGDDSEAFADAVARVYNDEQLWQVLSEGGRENVRIHFSHEVALSAITRLLAFSQDRQLS